MSSVLTECPHGEPWAVRHRIQSSIPKEIWPLTRRGSHVVSWLNKTRLSDRYST